MFGSIDSSKAKKPPYAADDPKSKRLLHEIEALSRALYLHAHPPRRKSLPSSHRSISAGKSHPPSASDPHKDKKPSASSSSSFWAWRPLRALSHARYRHFNCRFSLHVHSLDGLTPDLDGSALVVHWRSREGSAHTSPSPVSCGAVVFDETLIHHCSVHATGGGGRHHSFKYEAKLFLISVSAADSPGIDLGKHRFDLTRLLPLTLEELVGEKSSGKWSTSFNLSGRARGSKLRVSFGFSVLGDDSAVSGFEERIHPKVSVSKLDRNGVWSSPVGSNGHRRSRSIEEVRVLHEVLPTSKSDVLGSIDVAAALNYWESNDLTSTLNDLKVDDRKLKSFPVSDFGKGAGENEEDDDDGTEFTVIEQGIEIAKKDPVKVEIDIKDANNGTSVENVADNECGKGEGLPGLENSKFDIEYGIFRSSGEELSLVSCDYKDDGLPANEPVMEEFNSAIDDLSILGLEEFGSPQTPSRKFGELDQAEAKSNYEKGKMGRSLSLDDVTASVASEFLSMLGIEHSPFALSSDSDPESPRERLLKQFEKESLAGGGGIFDIGIGKEIGMESGGDSIHFDSEKAYEEFELPSFIHLAESDDKRATQSMKSKTWAKMMEDAETEALMQAWGLDENSFQRSAPSISDGFGSPIYLPPEEPLDLLPLGEGLGPLVQTKDGGFLRSMSPSLFKNAKNNGSLIMQVSSPIVVPAEMGSGIMEILQGLASVGIEKLSMQAKKLMPLEDVTGKTMQQVAWEALPALEARERLCTLQHRNSGGLLEVRQDAFGGKKKGKRSSSLAPSMGDTDSEYVSLEDFAPLAMEKIEALSLEGLQIQSGMSDGDAPANISSRAIGEISALAGLRANNCGSLGLEGAAGLQLMDVQYSIEDVDGLMGLSITLDEWMRLDAGIVDEEERNSGRLAKILAAHHANSADFVTMGSKGEKRGDRSSQRRYGLLGNNFTVALMVQLRDPLRNYEPVGTSMLALIQVGRVIIPPKPKIYCNVSLEGNSEEADEPELVVKAETEVEETVPQFKIIEVHLAGLKTEPGKKKLWGTTTQQQSGSRWLLASGMGKSNKRPFMKSKTLSKSLQLSTTVPPGDTLWSISSRVHGTGAKWKDLNPHIRNPNVIFPNETIRNHKVAISN